MDGVTGYMERAARVRLVLFDVDGVLTDGRILLDSNGVESRSFFVRDGLGIRVGQQAGLRFGIISGRDSRVVAQRAAELGIDEVHQGIHDKLGRLQEIRSRLEFELDQICFVGDDLIDLPVMHRVGFAAAPADAADEARDAAHYVTRCAGGRGAVREIIDLLLRAGGKWDEVISRWQ